MNTNFDRLAEEMTNLSGQRWECCNDYAILDDRYLSKGLQQFGKKYLRVGTINQLKPNQKLSLAELETLLLNNGINLSCIRVLLGGDIQNLETGESVFAVVFADLNEKLRDGTRVADNLANIQWSYTLFDYKMGGGEYFVDGSNIDINIEVGKTIKEYLAGKAIEYSNVEPCNCEVENYVKLRQLAHDALKNIEEKDYISKGEFYEN